MKSALANNADAFIPDEDILVDADPKNPDGRKVQVAVAGVPLPRADAMRAGLIKPSTDAEKAALADMTAGEDAAAAFNAEIEAKRSGGPSANKSAAPATEEKSDTKSSKK